MILLHRFVSISPVGTATQEGEQSRELLLDKIAVAREENRAALIYDREEALVLGYCMRKVHKSLSTSEGEFDRHYAVILERLYNACFGKLLEAEAREEDQA